jgi:hypothetical protein
MGGTILPVRSNHRPWAALYGLIQIPRIPCRSRGLGCSVLPCPMRRPWGDCHGGYVLCAALDWTASSCDVIPIPSRATAEGDPRMLYAARCPLTRRDGMDQFRELDGV